MTGRTFLAAIMLFVPITVAKVQAAPEDKPNSYYNGSTYQAEEPQVARHYTYKRSAAHKVSRPEIKKEEVTVSNDLARMRGIELIARMRKDIGRDPTGWGHQWCGRYLSMVTGRNGKRSVNLASNWQHEGTPAPRFAIGSVAVSEGHVAVVAPGGNCPSGYFNSISGNSAGHVVAMNCEPRSRYFSFRWVQIAGSKVALAPLPKPRPFYLPEPVQASIVPDIKLPEDAKPANYGLLGWIFSRETNYDNDTLPPPLRRESNFVRSGPFVMSVKPETMQPGDREAIIERDEIASYLCSVYKRTPRKVDNTGDFTWKDVAAAKRNGRTLCQEVIGGMSRKTQEAFYKTGKKLDSMSIRWSMLSAFRDDWRQRIAAGIKACDRCSLHGGSRWGGYGNGQAVDVTIVGDEENGPKRAGNLFAKYGPQFGLRRPFPGFDPAHVQVVNYVAKKNNAHRWLASNEDAAKAKPLPVKITPDETKSDTAIVQATPGPTVDVVTLEMAPKAEPPVKVASLGNEVPLKGMKRVFELVKAEASKYDLDPKLLMAIAYLENGESWSGLERETMTSAMGIFGLTAPERARMRQKDHSLPEQVRAGVRHIAEDARGLAGALKRTPTSAEIYYAHWIGAGAAMSVIKAKDTDNLRVAIDRGEPGLGWRALKANPALAKMKNVAAFKRSIDERMREARGAIRA